MSHEPNDFRINVSDRVHLSALEAGDKDALVALLNNKEIYDSTLRIPYPYSPDDADGFICSTAETTARHGHPIQFAIRDRENRLIGGCGFDGLCYGHAAEIGYWLAQPLWGQGVMTDVVRSACEFAQLEWKLVRITAHVFEFNRSSARVLEKCGFTFEGLLRKHHRKDNQFLDSRLYALLTPD